MTFLLFLRFEVAAGGAAGLVKSKKDPVGREGRERVLLD